MRKLLAIFMMMALCVSAWAAFPVTSLLDNFNRADENPLANGNWTEPIFSGGATALQVFSNQAAGAGEAYWSSATFGADTEAYITVATVPGGGSSTGLYVRMNNLNSGTLNGYECEYTENGGTDNFKIFKITTGTQSQLGTTQTGSVAAGDSIGCEVIGTAIKMYTKTGSTWTQVVSVTDGTYSGTGRIGFSSEDSSGRFDNFSGGTIPGASSPKHRVIMVM